MLSGIEYFVPQQQY